MTAFERFKPFLIHASVTLCFLAVMAAAAAGSVVYFGLYDISAVTPHTRPVYAILDVALRQTIHRRALAITAPSLDDPARAERGFRDYHRHCVACHGAPGVAPAGAGKGMMPVPNNLVDSARHLTSAEIYWVVRNGIKMTGMPAWQYRLTDAQLWDLVAFVRRLPGLSPDDYRALVHVRSK